MQHKHRSVMYAILPLLAAVVAVFVGLGAVGVSVIGTERAALDSAENYLPLIVGNPTPTPFATPVLPNSSAELIVQITPNGAINASTFNPNSFVIISPDTHDLRLLSVTIDLSTAIMPDMVFDPMATGGDSLAGDVDVDRDGGVGYSGRSYSGERNGGYDVIELNFNSFESGRRFEFSVDVDPNSIRGVGAPGPGDSGSVAGIELVGATVSAEFENGYTLSQQLYHIEDTGGAEAILREGLPDKPTLTLIDHPSLPTTVTERQQTIEISGPPLQPVRLLQTQAALYLDGVPVGSAPIEPYDANTMLWYTTHHVTIGRTGTVKVPVTLRRSGNDGALNYFTAVFDNFYGTHGATSDPLIVTLSE